ncbi:MAG TPA: biotin/lipoyl-containing protein [Oxalicibacterium sp.]|nr:biotin/lipoyl-containing protein [Oxalicibacterium sp.]
MLIEVKVPELTEGATEATLLGWNKKKGDRVTEGDNLTDLETTKVVVEIVAPATGTLVEIVKEEGADVGEGDVIARIETGA